MIGRIEDRAHRSVLEHESRDQISRGALISQTPGGGVIRLDPMDEATFQESLKRVIPRLAELQAKRGLWTAESALEAARSVYTGLLPRGRETPHNYLCSVVDVSTNARVGEVWYKTDELGGKVDFTIEWIWTEPSHRRKGYATQALQLVEREARRLGAERAKLYVWMDNPEAVALYTKLGFSADGWLMRKSLMRPRE
jgi:ribosomal protein S18 acetylase RimI-like enzyme